jgi:Domain of unknown function (DUF4194)
VSAPEPAVDRLPVVVTHLLKGVVDSDRHPAVWPHLVAQQNRVRDYVAVLGLVPVIDEAEGYAFLRSRPDDERAEGEIAPARLIPRRALSYPVSLLLALLRKRLAEFDVSGTGGRCVVTRDQMVDLLQVYLPPARTETRGVEQIEVSIGKVVDLGFLDRVGDGRDGYEIRRVIKAFVDAEWLAAFDRDLRVAAGEDDAGQDDSTEDDPTESDMTEVAT